MRHAAKLSLLAAVCAVCGVGVLLQSGIDRRQQSAAPGQLYSVVWKQVAAFRASDYASAYQQASSGFQEKFNIEAFSDMVRTEYPGLGRAKRVEFGAVQIHGRHAIVPTYFFLPDGDVIPCVYTLVNEDDAWKIDGARVLRRWPAGLRLGGLRT